MLCLLTDLNELSFLCKASSTTDENVLSLDCAVCSSSSSCFSVQKLPVCPTHIFICLVCSSMRLFRLLPRGGNLSDSQWPRILWRYTYGQWLFSVDRADPRLRFCFNLWDAGLWCAARSANVFWRNYGLSWLLAFPLLTAVELTVVERGDKNTMDTWNGSFFFFVLTSEFV